jgi:hypothetical protein
VRGRSNQNIKLHTSAVLDPAIAQVQAWVAEGA